MPVIACPHCGKALKLPAGFAKTRARCRFCDRGFAITDARQLGTPQPEPDISFLLAEDHAPRPVDAKSPTDWTGPPPVVPVDPPPLVTAVPTMGLFSWLFGSTPTRGSSRVAAQAELPGPGEFGIEVVGELHYQEALEAICGGRTRESARVVSTAVLVLDDSNPYDSKAVRVEISGHVVGYLSRENARQYRKKLKEAGYPRITASCKALIVGGWDRGNGDRGHFGVRLDLPVAEE